MPFASYSVRRAGWPLWKWEADYHGEAAAQGYSLTKGAARWAARGWLRNRGSGLMVQKAEAVPLAAE